MADADPDQPGDALPAIADALAARARAVLERAGERGLSIVTAESCTGGLLAAFLTDIEGVSGVFERGFVVYSPEAKCELLGIEAALIDRRGAVSEEVARAMAKGALAGSRGDVAVAITGFAGPAGPDDEPGLVHLAYAGPAGRVEHRELHLGDIGRRPVRQRCIEEALAMLEQALT